MADTDLLSLQEIEELARQIADERDVRRQKELSEKLLKAAKALRQARGV